MKKNNINIALSPNNTFADTFKAFQQIIFPWNWFSFKKGKAISKLENTFKDYFQAKHAFSIGSGREALYLILQSLNLQKDDEVILQSFTCMVVVNSIIWNGLMPKYIDIDADTYNLDSEKLEQKITSKTRVVIVQHTFGIPAEVEKIKKICEKHQLILIEDCAHALGAEFSVTHSDNETKKIKVGTLGDIAFFSLGRSKVISCVNGGMIIVNNEKMAANIAVHLKKLPYPSNGIILKNLFHPIAFSTAKFFYNFFGLGKIFLVGLQKMRLLTMEIKKSEKRGEFETPFPTLLPNALAKIALIQFEKLEQFNLKRKKIADFYYEKLKNISGLKIINPADFPGAIFLRYPVQIENKEKLLIKAKTRGIILGDWYTTAIAPPGINLVKTFYVAKDYPTTEKVCQKVINLPTYPGLKQKDLESIVELFRISE